MEAECQATESSTGSHYETTNYRDDTFILAGNHFSGGSASFISSATTISGSEGGLDVSVGGKSIKVSYRGTNANLVLDSLRSIVRDKRLQDETAPIDHLTGIFQETDSLGPSDSISFVEEFYAPIRDTGSVYSATNSTVAPGRVAGSFTTASFTDAGDLQLVTTGQLCVRVAHPEDGRDYSTVAMLDSGATGPSPNFVTKSFLEDDLRCPYTEESSVADLPGGHTLPICGRVRLKFYPQFQNRHTGQHQEATPYRLTFRVVDDHENDSYFGDMCLGLNAMRDMRVSFNASYIIHTPNTAVKDEEEPAKLGSKSSARSRWSQQVERLSEKFRPSKLADKAGRRNLGCRHEQGQGPVEQSQMTKDENIGAVYASCRLLGLAGILSMAISYSENSPSPEQRFSPANYSRKYDNEVLVHLSSLLIENDEYPCELGPSPDKLYSVGVELAQRAFTEADDVVEAGHGEHVGSRAVIS
ncbi:hypothetical protein BJ166DRAFT_577521 [Pestalotiopsis sp. NC0098]|nr:hypothetical protein BJ166DRAFT_577521 [Pestalotiopsis sp. NC0098]